MMLVQRTWYWILLIFFFILITCKIDILLMLLGEIQLWSLKGIEGLAESYCIFVVAESSHLFVLLNFLLRMSSIVLTSSCYAVP